MYDRTLPATPPLTIWHGSDGFPLGGSGRSAAPGAIQTVNVAGGVGCGSSFERDLPSAGDDQLWRIRKQDRRDEQRKCADPQVDATANGQMKHASLLSVTSKVFTAAATCFPGCCRMDTASVLPGFEMFGFYGEVMESAEVGYSFARRPEGS